MAKFHSASPREITSPFTSEIISELHSKACNYLYLYYTLHTEHAYCLSYRFLNNVVITTVIEMVEMVEILDGRLGKRSVERVRYVINLVIVKYGDISLVLCISTRLRLVIILSLLVKYLVILHADLCNKSYICMYVFDCLWENNTKKFYAKMRGRNYVVQTRTCSKSSFGILKRSAD